MKFNLHHILPDLPKKGEEQEDERINQFRSVIDTLLTGNVTPTGTTGKGEEIFTKNELAINKNNGR